jgi:hypothetical protein
MQVNQSGLNGQVPQKTLDQINIDALFEQVCCKTMPQRVDALAPGNAGRFLGAVIDCERRLKTMPKSTVANHATLSGPKTSQ